MFSNRNANDAMYFHELIDSEMNFSIQFFNFIIRVSDRCLILSKKK